MCAFMMRIRFHLRLYYCAALLRFGASFGLLILSGGLIDVCTGCLSHSLLALKVHSLVSGVYL